MYGEKYIKYKTKYNILKQNLELYGRRSKIITYNNIRYKIRIFILGYSYYF
jgi:hypothetical protein